MAEILVLIKYLKSLFIQIIYCKNFNISDNQTKKIWKNPYFFS